MNSTFFTSFVHYKNINNDNSTIHSISIYLFTSILIRFISISIDKQLLYCCTSFQLSIVY